MTFDPIFGGIALLFVLAGLSAGALRAGAALALLPLCVAGAMRLEPAIAGLPPVLTALAVWVALAGLLSMAPRRPARRPGAVSRLIGALLGAVQAVAAPVLLSGVLLGSVYRDAPDASASLREASAYQIVAQIGRRLPAAARLPGMAFPEPVAEAPDPAPELQPRPVDWAEARAWTGTAVRVLPGRVEATERASLAFEIDGRISAMTVHIGDHFAAGDVLARLETRALEIRLQEREAALIEAEAQLAEARQQLDRQSALFERGVVAEARLDNARAAHDSAAARVDAAQAAIDQARESLDDAVLRAPFDGSVAARLAEPAQTVGAVEPVFEVQSNGGGFEITATVPDTLVGRLRVGSEHGVGLLDGSDAEVTAELTEIGTRATSTAGFPVTLRVQDAGGNLRAGLSAEVRLRLVADRSTTQLVAVPLTAVAVGPGQTRAVFVHDAGAGVLRRQPVTLAGTEGDLALIGSGLAAGARVAVRGVPFLSDGMPVTLRGVGVARYDT